MTDFRPPPTAVRPPGSASAHSHDSPSPPGPFGGPYGAASRAPAPPPSSPFGAPTSPYPYHAAAQPPRKNTGLIVLAVVVGSISILSTCGGIAAVFLARAPAVATATPPTTGTTKPPRVAAGEIQEIRADVFEAEVMAANVPVLVDFTASWCSACKVMRPELEGFAKRMKGKVKVVSVDYDASPKLAREHSVSSLPTLLLFDQGSLVERRVGALRRSDLDLMILPYVDPEDEDE